MTKPNQKAEIVRDSLRLPLVRYRRIGPKSETEILVGPSLAWLIFLLVALFTKGLGLVGLVQAMWRGFP
jgi:hypothetical protein